MAQSPAPTLDQLQASDSPAWLWDGARARVVWANPAGIALFAGETLFDLIDRPFDARDPDIVQITHLTETLQRSESRSAKFGFSAASEDELTVNCNCSIHSLPDGRAGLLVVGEQVQRTDGPGDPALMTDILSAMPIAIVVADMRGDIVFANAAAGDLIARANRGDVAALLGAREDAEAMIERVKSARTLSMQRVLATNFGDRDIRVTARLLSDHEEAEAVQVLLMLEDVTDRRALERALSDNKGAAAPATAQEITPAPAPASPAGLEDISRAISEEMAVQVELPMVPDLVSRALNRLDEAIVLHRGNKFYFANEAAMRLLGYDDAIALTARTDLMAQLAANARQIEIACGDGKTRNVAVSVGTFPWHDGPLVKSTITPSASAPAATPEPEVSEPAPRPNGIPTTKSPVAETPEVPAVTENVVPLVPAAAAQQRAAGPDDPELRAILDTATDGIVTLDGDGAILSFSAGAEALFGYRLAEVAGKPFADLLAIDSRATLRDYLAALGEGGIASVFNDGREVTGVVSQDGEISLFMTIARLSGDSGAAFCAVLRDITQWKKTEAQLRLDKEEAEVSNAQKSEFLARISHELRTPLNAILGFSDVMRTERFGQIENQQYLGYANDIHKSGSHLLSLINDLLDLSKVEAGKLELNFTSVDLRGIVDECFSVMQEQAVAARVVLRKSLPADLPNIVADFRSITQILLNLLSNAIKFTDPGGQVIVSAKLSRAGELKIKIKDTGIGMDKAELQTALEPFKRIETPKRSPRLGTGLGLPLTKALTEANRARFDISSEHKKGTLVEITFPTTRVLAD
ncbi:MAG: PAS domain S-box protein [Rhizobiales bacterium]|nr:PAS domain S-box protein [Hyphomicrobiales bacterium]